VDADGDAVFTWQRFDGTGLRAQARARNAAGTLSAVQDLSDPFRNAFSPQVAVDDTGDAVFTWLLLGTNNRIQARARSAAGALSAVQNISEAGQSASQPQVAVDPDGDAVFTWRRFDGTNFRVQARARTAAGALSPVQTLSKSGRDASNPQVAVDDTGDAVFTWVRSDGTNDRAQARARSAAGALSAVQDLSKRGQDAVFPQVGVDAGGDAVFTWQGFDGTNTRAQARARSAAGALSAVQNLSNPGQNASSPQIAVDDTGDAVFTWVRSDGTHNLVEARTRSAAGALRPLTLLSDPGQNGFSPQVGVDADGDAAVAWRRFDGANDRIQASAGP
jgi:microcompartment protein CcmK/EutM